MKRKIFYSIFLLLLVFTPRGLRGQTAETNAVNNWVYPAAQKYVGMDFVNTASGTLINNGAIWFSRNFTNNGTVDFVNTLAQDPALTQFSGTSTQRISGSGSTRFYGLFLGSDLVTNAFSLEQDITVAHQANFVKGILVSKQTTPESMENRVLFEKDAGCINASDLSFLDGFGSKTGNTAFTFPVGNDGFYSPVSISAPASATDCFAARYLHVNPDDAGYARSSKDMNISQVSDKEYWVLNRVAGTSDVQVTLGWDGARTGFTLPGDLGKVRIVRWDGAKWINEGNVATTGNASAGTVTAAATGYGVFTLAMYSIPSKSMDDSTDTWQNYPVSGNVFGNDSTFLGNTLSLTGFGVGDVVNQPGTTATIPNVGTITISADGAYTFTPDLNYRGTVPAISYTAVDTDGNPTGANLSIVVRPLPTISKTASKPVMNNDGTFNLVYTITVSNDTPATVDSIQVSDNLDDVFKAIGCTYKVTSVLASGNLKANGVFNGSTDINTLVEGGSVGANATDSIQIGLRVDTHGQSGALTVFNQAVFNGKTMIAGQAVYMRNIKSDGNLTTSVKEPTSTDVPEMATTIPDAFSPDGDGINDKFVIVHAVSTRIDLEVYNRWGLLVFKSADYQNDWDGTGVGAFLGKELVSGTYYVVYKEISVASGEVINKNVKYITLRR
ncbi:MAG TPA: gliding motility-associated C-terminal domain-containing protein [Paludibacter sp.]|nr:gliding motility-associated C-terminal domain-containing protein [Paludibacter sp.]